MNEALFREVNERIAQLDRETFHGWRAADDLLEVFCECGAARGCDQRLAMTIIEYERVRAQDDRFAVAPGHETGTIERVVERTDRYLIVDKVPAVEKFTRDDPRGAPSA